MESAIKHDLDEVVLIKPHKATKQSPHDDPEIREAEKSCRKIRHKMSKRGWTDE